MILIGIYTESIVLWALNLILYIHIMSLGMFFYNKKKT